jgi:hypothetical protein
MMVDPIVVYSSQVKILPELSEMCRELEVFHRAIRWYISDAEGLLEEMEVCLVPTIAIFILD